MERTLNALTESHKFMREHIKEGDFCIDGTAGRGNDTVFMAGLVGKSGKVIAFDIQQEAIDSTTALINEKGVSDIAEVYLDSHSNMDKYAKKGTVSCICFNFGWLPRGDHNIFTKPDTSIEAITKGLELLKDDGVMSICIYYGKETGYMEHDALLEFFKTIDYTKYTVVVSQFANRHNCPAIPVFIYKGI